MVVKEPESAPALDPSGGASLTNRVIDRLWAWDEAVRSRWPFAHLFDTEVPEGASAGDGSQLLVRPAVLGFIAICAIVAGASQPNSPFTLKAPGAWFFGVPASKAAGISHDSAAAFFGLVAVFGGLVLLMRVWYGLIRTLTSRSGVPVRKLMAVFALWILPLLIVAPLFSRDAYSYVAQGEMMSHHISPYHYGPSVLGAAPSVSFVDPLWVNTPTPYGPLFMGIDGALTSLSLHHELPNLILLRLLAIAGVLLIAFGVVSLARSYGRDPAYVLTLAILNPVTILYLVGGAHNDALMLGLLVAGVAVARRGRPVAGIVLCALAAAVKVPAAIGIVYIGWEWMGAGMPLRNRVRPLLTAALIAGAVMGALSFVTGLGWSWAWNLAAPGTVRLWVAPATGLGIAVTDAAHALGIGVPLHAMLSVTRSLGLLAALVAGLWLLWRSEKIGSLRAMGLTFLLVVALAPVVQPWYLSWGLVLLAPVAVGKVRTVVIAASVAGTFIGLPGARLLVSDVIQADPLRLVVVLLVCLLIVTVPLVRVLRPRRRFLDRPVIFQLLVLEAITVSIVTFAVSMLNDASHYAFDVLKLAGACALGLFALYGVFEAIAAMRTPRLPALPGGTTPGPTPAATAIVPAYLPNEAGIIVETVMHHLTTGPSDLQVIIAYNTPVPNAVEHELADLAKENSRLVVLRVDDSHSKAENVNAALDVATGSIIGVFDADHHPASDSYARAWRWLANGADVVQGRCVVRKREGRNSLVSMAVTAEFEQMYSVGHPGRTRIMGIGLFGGSNGFWRADALRSIRLDPSALTEDIDASVRLLRAGGRIATDPGIVSGELSPPTWEALCNQRLRWAQGWFQVGRRHLGGVLKDPQISWRRRIGVFWLWGWGTVLPWIGVLSIPLTIHGWLHHDVSPWSRIIGYILLFGTVSFIVHVGVAFRKAVPGTLRPRVFATYIAANLVFYAYIRVALTRLGHIHEFAGRTEWFVTPRTIGQVATKKNRKDAASVVQLGWPAAPGVGVLAASADGQAEPEWVS